MRLLTLCCLMAVGAVGMQLHSASTPHSALVGERASKAPSPEDPLPHQEADLFTLPSPKLYSLPDCVKKAIMFLVNQPWANGAVARQEYEVVKEHPKDLVRWMTDLQKRRPDYGNGALLAQESVDVGHNEREAAAFKQAMGTWTSEDEADFQKRQEKLMNLFWEERFSPEKSFGAWADAKASELSRGRKKKNQPTR